MKPRIGSLFSGGGFLDLAVLQVFAGEVVWHSQYEPPDKDGKEKRQFAAEVLDYRWPGVPNLGDINLIDFANVEPVDIVCGGFPCTDISNAGKRAGIEGERSGLWARMADAIGVLRPRLVVIENVAVLTIRGLDRVLADLARLGFDAEWASVPASTVGAPHRRDRIFIIANYSDPSRAGAWAGGNGSESPESLGCGGPATDAGGSSRQSLGHAESGNGAGSDGFGATEPRGCGSTPADSASDRRRERRTESEGFERGSDAAVCGTAASDSARGSAADIKDGGNASGFPVGTEFGAGVGDRGGNIAAGVEQLGRGSDVVDWGRYEPAIRRWEGVLGRPAPAPWQISERTGNRQLSARFTEWMMGLPDGWVTDVPDMTRNGALHVLGNGVVPQQAVYALGLLLQRPALAVAS